MSKVNLEALIPREDFEIAGVQNSTNLFSSISITNFTGGFFYPFLRKPDFQRETNEWENNSGITIQNTLRRILENYFSILGSKRDDVLINKFSTQEEREICRSLLSWANEGSHTLELLLNTWKCLKIYIATQKILVITI